ncbi:hypothetical protein KOW79_003064 [Hemibagrus wyckioides]|uniref:Uncharacterized protein n=1 Tax=Hemibagrus wyckioides TaxID=337641 RepID=A0A9D3SV17_9TELE|nr:hypothetical protein KOW79_003064 [Hemibagrus wyckioides]
MVSRATLGVHEVTQEAESRTLNPRPPYNGLRCSPEPLLSIPGGGGGCGCEYTDPRDADIIESNSRDDIKMSPPLDQHAPHLRPASSGPASARAENVRNAPLLPPTTRCPTDRPTLRRTRGGGRNGVCDSSNTHQSPHVAKQEWHGPPSLPGATVYFRSSHTPPKPDHRVRLFSFSSVRTLGFSSCTLQNYGGG